MSITVNHQIPNEIGNKMKLLKAVGKTLAGQYIAKIGSEEIERSGRRGREIQ